MASPATPTPIAGKLAASTTGRKDPVTPASNSDEPEEATAEPSQPTAVKPVAQGNSDTDEKFSSAKSHVESNEVKPAVDPKAQLPDDIASEVTTKTPTIETATAVAKPALISPQTHAVIQQLTDRIELMAAVKPKDGMTVHLQPSDLGTVSLVVKSVGKTIDAEIFASNPAVRDALESSKSEFAISVQHRGLQLTNVTVGSQASSSNTSHQQSQARQTLESNLSESNSRQQQTPSQRAARSSSTISREEQELPIVSAIRQGSTVDIAI